MKEILKYWEKTFYTGGISFLLGIIALLVSIWKRKENQKLKPLFFFLLAYTLGQVIVLFEVGIGLFSAAEKHRIFLYADFTDTIIEFIAFFYVIKNHVASKKLKRFLDPLLPIFLGVTLIYFFYYNIVNSKIDNFFLQVIFTIEASFLIMACGFYYIDLFTLEPKFRLTIYPSFWVVTGIAFFMLCTLPFSIIGLYLVEAKRQLYDQLFIVFEVFYWILFLMIIKAYYCKPEQA